MNEADLKALDAAATQALIEQGWTPPPANGEYFLVAYVSQDSRVVGIHHETEADWQEVLAAHEALYARVGERIAEKANCPFLPDDTRAKLAPVDGDAVERDMIEADERLGAWMSAALDDPSVCDAMKRDIENWFASFRATLTNGGEHEG